MDIVIKSDGTIQGTTVTVDGTDITDEENVVYSHFTASVRYDPWVTFGYSTRETNEDGSTEITSYEFNSPSTDTDTPLDYSTGATMRKVVRPAGLGREVAEDEAAFLTSKVLIGDKFKGNPTIDMAAINPRHAHAVADLMKGQSYRIVDTRGKGKGTGGPPQGDGGADVCIGPKGQRKPKKKGVPCVKQYGKGWKGASSKGDDESAEEPG